MTRITSPNTNLPPRRRRGDRGNGASRGSDVLFYLSIAVVAAVLSVIIGSLIRG